MTEKPKRKRRGAMPDPLRRRAAAAAKVHENRFTPPEVEVTPHGYGSPYRSADEAEWWRLLGEAFGTRMASVITVFLEQVARLVPNEWDEVAKRNVPNADHLNAALAIVASMKPRTEAEAAQAAQAFALHVMAMKVSANAARSSFIDPRQANALANLVKAYTGAVDSLKASRGTRSSKQTIVVKKQVNITNDNRSVTLPRGGISAADRSDGPCSATRAQGASDCTIEGRTGSPEGSPTVPGPTKTLVRAVRCSGDAR